jgi:hypothetical protein
MSRMSASDVTEARRDALQSTAEMMRGLDVLEAELRHGMVKSALETVNTLRAVLMIADAALVAALRASGGERVG